MNKEKIIVSAVAVTIGLAAIGEALGIWFLKTSNSNLKATGTALSGENAGCDATQAAMKGQINSLGAEATRLWNIVESQRAQLIQMASGTPVVVEVIRQNDVTRVVTVEVTPTGLKCYPLVTATRTPTETNTATATRTATLTASATLPRPTNVNTEVSTQKPTDFVPTNTQAPTDLPVPTNTNTPQPTNTEQILPTATADIPTPAPTNTEVIPTATISTP